VGAYWLLFYYFSLPQPLLCRCLLRHDYLQHLTPRHYASSCRQPSFPPPVLLPLSIRQHTSADASTCDHTSAHVSIRQHTSTYVSIRQHTSAYVSRRHHTSSPLTLALRAWLLVLGLFRSLFLALFTSLGRSTLLLPRSPLFPRPLKSVLELLHPHRRSPAPRPLLRCFSWCRERGADRCYRFS
jgi:hypothetical protein